MQLIAAGVPEDWVDFVQRSGHDSGTLARVLPIIGCDREMIRLLQAKLPAVSIPLEGLKTVLSIMEEKFTGYRAAGKPPIILKFADSKLLNKFRLQNDIATNNSRVVGDFNYKSIFTTLLDKQPPNSDSLKAEGSGIGQVGVFISQMESEWKTLIKSPGDANSLHGLSTNLLRVCSD